MQSAKVSIGYKQRLSSNSTADNRISCAKDRQRPTVSGNAKYFSGVRVLHFRAGRESLYVDEFAGREGTLNHVWFSRTRNSVWIIPLGYLCRRRRAGRRRVFLSGRVLGRRRGVWIEWLLTRRGLSLS